MRTNMFKVGLIALVVAAVLMACSPPSDTAVSPTPAGSQLTDLEGTEWVLASIDGSGPAEGAVLTMAFYPDLYLEGDAGCNSFGTDYTLDNGKFRIAQLHRTNFQCDLPGEIKEQEARFFAALEGAAGILATEDRLELMDATGALRLAFSRKRPPTVDPELLDTEWILVYLKGTAPLAGSRITLNFDQEGAGGFAGCNSYGGEYQAADGGVLSIPEIWQTEMDCERSDVMEQESVYVETLRTTATYRIIEGRLELKDTSGESLLRYERQEERNLNPADLLGTMWRLVSLDGASPFEGAVFTLAFHNEALVSGQAGCRDYIATYSASRDGMQFTYMAMMGADCPERETLMRQEGQYTSVLGWTSRYRLEGDQLELLSERGELLTFERLAEETAANLAGSEWVLLALIEDKEVEGMPETIALVWDLLPGTEVTASFDEERVHGSAGCNTYRADYDANEASNLTFAPVASTKMACQEPEGVMEQEQRYLNVLGQVTRFRRFYDRLWLETGSGQALVFRASVPEAESGGDSSPQTGGRDCSGPDAFPTEEAEVSWPVISEVSPNSAAPGEEVQITASGGYLSWVNECGQYWLESARDFQVLWDGEPQNSITCYVNMCVAIMTVPADAGIGMHILSLEGGSSLEVEVKNEP